MELHYTHRLVSMNTKKCGQHTKKQKRMTVYIIKKEKRHKVPAWVDKSIMPEENLCPDCFKVVGVQSRYKLVCMLGKTKEGMTVAKITKNLRLQQPTVTHHLNVLRSVDAVSSTDAGRERIYKLNRKAHCFEECKIPF